MRRLFKTMLKSRLKKLKGLFFYFLLRKNAITLGGCNFCIFILTEADNERRQITIRVDDTYNVYKRTKNHGARYERNFTETDTSCHTWVFRAARIIGRISRWAFCILLASYGCSRDRKIAYNITHAILCIYNIVEVLYMLLEI